MTLLDIKARETRSRAADAGGRAGARSEARSKSRRSSRNAIRPRDWVLTIVIALSAAMFIRGFLIEAFRIPTSSMEKSLLVGDFVLVSKLHYGPRIPLTLGIPFTDIYLDASLPPFRLPGFSKPHRGDIAVFNYPGDTGPIDRKTHYIKRIVALPGDTLSIVDKDVYVNGFRSPHLDGMQQKWLLYQQPDALLPIQRLRRNGIGELDAMRGFRNALAFEATEAVAREVESWSEVKSVEPFVLPRDPGIGLRVFPEGSGFGRDNYGPLHVPAKGDLVPLNRDTWPLYKDIVTRYEGHTAALQSDGTYAVDGVQTDTYRIEQDYYFAMGDNRDSSFDSRIWGFVPADHLVGKAVTIYFSFDKVKGKPRYDRIFQPIR